MLQLQALRENPEHIIERLSVKNFPAETIVAEILSLDRNRRETQKNLDDILAQGNQIARSVAQLFKEGKGSEAEGLKQASQELKARSKELTEKLAAMESELDELLVRLPNLPHPKVPLGKHAADNEVVASWGEFPVLPENALPHWELAAKYRLIDFELGAKVTGSGFPFYIGNGARLQRSLIAFFLDRAVDAGYTEYQTPLMVNEDSAYGTGQLPDKEGQMYVATGDNLYLIPTAEVPLTNIFRDTILREEDLPVQICAYSSCFRREAGSYGKDVRGLNRLHQFDKVEIVQVAHPDTSYENLEAMREHVSGLLKALNLPFRIVRLCGGDMSFASAMTYDFEVWSAAQQRWLEVSSVSNFESFQSNRMKLRFRETQGKVRLAHTLNGSALALPRIVAALLENNQTAGGIRIPDALVPYTGFQTIGDSL
ncbi:MAG TPA: serine--tRNA ligase [Bacteroidales bacterium]|nr:serine--tRNA ligase [Bacteroidales bacterium]HRZ49530.1 serine--tRNA ligase [Bacteroidales bacterium]